jgi:hypothetical protein
VTKLPKWILIIFSVALSLTVGFVDYLTGDYGITVIYILPIYLSAKLLGQQGCLGVTILCVLELSGFALLGRWMSEIMIDAIFWNTVLQSAELGITGYLIAQFTSPLCQQTQK